ncbi:MAG: phage tail tape measure protein [Alphaproteobacteria bacterium]|nr:phage tail tape measure protein [Alphaproteobacteria bacterium]
MRPAVQGLDDFGEVGQGPGEPVDFVDDHQSRASAATRSAVRSLSSQVSGLVAAYAGFSGLRRSLQLFAEFDEGLIAVAKTTDLSRDEVREFGRSITDLSKRIPVAAKELLDIGATAGQLGVSGSRDLLRFTDTVAKLGRASNLAGEEAATALARMLNVTGENIGEVGRLASVIVRLGNNMAVTEREIARMATEVSLATANFRVGTTAASAIGAAMASLDRQLVQHGGVVHLVPRRLRVVGPEDETMAALQVADIGHVDLGVGVLSFAKVRRIGHLRLFSHRCQAPNPEVEQAIYRIAGRAGSRLLSIDTRGTVRQALSPCRHNRTPLPSGPGRLVSASRAQHKVVAVHGADDL